jgi:hypothetical protein
LNESAADATDVARGLSDIRRREKYPKRVLYDAVEAAELDEPARWPR